MSHSRLSQVGGLRSVVAMALGIALLVYLIKQVDAPEVWRTLVGTGAWLPLLAALEAVQLFTDTAAFAGLIASARPIPTRGWLRSSAGSYLCLVLLPAGRALGEAARAVLATPYVGARRAAMAGAELQAVALLADGVVTLAAACAAMFAVGSSQHLASALFGIFGLVTFSGVALLFLVRNPRAGRWLRRTIPRLARFFPEGVSGSHGSVWPATTWSIFGRGVQVVQYGVAILAVGGNFGVKSALIAHGIHMVGATVGVAVPNQVGVGDGAYVLFAQALGFASEPARALAAVLAVRCAQLLLAAACVSVLALLREQSPTPSPAC